MAALRANLPVARLAGHADLPQPLLACAQSFPVTLSPAVDALIEGFLALVVAPDKRGIAVRARLYRLAHAAW
jgi:hypothetical protein